ncbi:MAG: uracil-DNA glycosylase [Planctomycetes bacterium]|nr:uracil-DNA glycosylase [Planctomycetota bacterium]
MKRGLQALDRDVIACERCERLVAWCRRVAREKKAAFREHEYWGKPVPSFGDHAPELLIVGLAPGAHGANRTGRPFTGDGAGPFLYSALHRAGFASAPESLHRKDGLELVGARITNAVRCAPPGNRPSPDEALACRPFLVREFELCRSTRVILALGAFAWNEVLTVLAERGATLSRPRPRFGHAAEFAAGPEWPVLLGSYHPSQQVTRTGRLTPAMLDRVLARARSLSRAAGRSRG